MGPFHPASRYGCNKIQLMTPQNSCGNIDLILLTKMLHIYASSQVQKQGSLDPIRSSSHRRFLAVFASLSLV